MAKGELAPRGGEIVIYQTEGGQTKIEVRLEGETLWLSQAGLAELYQTTKQNISLHIANIYEEGELYEDSVVKEYLTTAADGKKYKTKHYNLDMIISVGYRIKSHIATHFRQWATQRLREYIVKGFTMDDERLKEGVNIGSDYFDEMLERIRDIRSSEKRFYQKIRDILENAGTVTKKLRTSWPWSNTILFISINWHRKPSRMPTRMTKNMRNILSNRKAKEKTISTKR